MEELIERIGAKAGIASDAARNSVAALLSYLDKNAPKGRMEELYAAVPGTEALVGKRRGGIFGAFGGGLMGVYTQLSSSGLSNEQMQRAGEELLAFAREKVGDDAVDDVIGSVPALRQLL